MFDVVIFEMVHQMCTISLKKARIISCHIKLTTLEGHVMYPGTKCPHSHTLTTVKATARSRKILQV